MTEQVKRFLELFKTREYRNRRIDNGDFDVTELVNREPKPMRDTIVMEQMLKHETPNILEGDIIGFNRKLKNLPYYVNAKGRKVKDGPGNNTPNYRRVIETGFDAILEQIDAYAARVDDEDTGLFYQAMRRSVVSVLDIADRYRIAAEEQGNTHLAKALAQVPHKPATSFYEACVFFKIIVYTLRCTHATHMTIGRFDQYMLSYYEEDLKRGVSREELFEVLEMLFISLNLDGDIYFGCQQGDNGQSLVLGGYDKEGNDQFNDLSMLCMEASLELTLIDPKINLRVSKKTPDWMYELGTKLTKQGLGFPQYCNDDLIVPYMISLGYDEEDAYNYTVAACWEVLSPNNGWDIPNRKYFAFPMVVNEAIHRYLPTSATFEELLERVREVLFEKAKQMQEECRPDWNAQINEISPRRAGRCMYLSLFVDGCLEKGLDMTAGGAKYNNYGILGSGIANAADALTAVHKVVYDDKLVSAEELLAALDADFEGYEELRNTLLSCPKMGNNDDYADENAAFLMDACADAYHGKPNGAWGGVWRAGTGSAQSYIVASKQTPATADGRKAYTPYSCSFSPAITTKVNGPLSILQSFTKHDLSRMCNGGPLTMELHDTVFRNPEGEKKVAQLVKAFVHMGGHQFQLNSINRDRLLDAKAHPEQYPNLIVRVWGWSGYFCELDQEYQDHIISRAEHMV